MLLVRTSVDGYRLPFSLDRHTQTDTHTDTEHLGAKRKEKLDLENR